MRLATRSLAMTPQANIQKTAYFVGCVITLALWALVIVIAAAIA